MVFRWRRSGCPGLHSVPGRRPSRRPLRGTGRSRKRCVHIAATADEFVKAIETALTEDGETRSAKAAEHLATMSWDKTQKAMAELIDEVIERKEAADSSAAHA